MKFFAKLKRKLDVSPSIEIRFHRAPFMKSMQLIYAAIHTRGISMESVHEVIPLLELHWLE